MAGAMQEIKCTTNCQNIERANFELAESSNEIQYKHKHYFTADDSLLDAAQRGDLNEVTRLIKEGSDVNAKDSSGSTPLHFAAEYGHVSVAEYLVNEGKVDVNAKDNKGEIPLQYADKNGNLDIVKCLIEKFSIENGYTSLHWAAEKGSLDIVKYLVDVKEVDVNIRDRNWYTPLHYAAQNGKLDTVKYLIGIKKADLDVKGKNGETPAQLAAKNNHLGTVEYLVSEAYLSAKDNSSLNKANGDVGDTMLHAKKKGEIIDRIIGIADIAFGVKDILQEFGILPDKQSEDFEKVLYAIEKNHAAIEKVGNKVDRNFVAMKEIFEVVSKTLSTIEETRVEMRHGFKQVLDSINELRVGDKISSLATFMEDFTRNVDVVKKFSPNVRVAELERSGGILDKLRSAVTSDGILHGNLYHVINQRLAIPKDAEDNVAFATLHVLYYAAQTYVSEMFFVLDQYSYLADYYYQKGDIEKCNEYFDLLQISFVDFKESLLRNGNKKRIIDKVTDILSEVQGLIFVRNEREDVFELLQKRIDSLSLVTQKLQEMVLPIVADQPEIIMRKPDFSTSDVKTPIGKWNIGAKVSYAIQYKYNNTYSKIGEWSNAYTVDKKANPILKVPVDPQKRTRLIFRKFLNEKPELVGAIETKTQISFRDISRDLYDAALSSNEDIAKKEVEILVSNGADVNEVYDDGRRAIHAAAQGGNFHIASEFLIKNNATDINVKDINGCTPIYIAAEAGYEDFVNFSINNGADVNVKTNSQNFTPLHISAYKGDVSTVRVLMKSDEIDMNDRDKAGFAPLHSAVFGGTEVIKTLFLSNNTDINAKSNEGLTPLHLASINDFEDVIEVLIKNNNVDINALAKGNLTALHFASSLGNTKIVRSLVEQNETDVNIKSADGWTALHFATFLKKEDTATELLKAEGIEINAKGKSSITPLHVATVSSQQNIVLSLLQKGALTEDKNQDSLTALHLAAKHNKYEMVPILLQNGANIEAKTINGSTPLHLASFAGSSNSTSVLLNSGADTKLFDNNGYIPIHVAIVNGKIKTVKILVEYEKDLVNVTDKAGEFPLHLAARTDYADVISFLISNKVDINVRNKAGETPLHCAAKYDSSYAIQTLADNGASLDTKDNSGWAPVHWAARNNCPRAIKALAQKDANLTIRDNDSFAPLHLAAKYNCPKAIEALAEAKVDLNIRDNDGSTPLHLAAKNNSSDAVDCLAKMKAEVNARDKFSLTPLLLATKNNYFNTVKCLVENGADIAAATTYKIDNYTQNGYSSIHYAVRNDNIDIVKYLVRKGANPEATTTSNKDTPLHLAAEDGYLDIVKYLIEEEKVNVNAVNYNVGRIPLHFASEKGHSDIIHYLVEKKADVRAKDYSGRTPLHFSIENGNLDTVKYLIEKGADFTSPITTPNSYFYSYTCIYFAVMNNHLDIVKYFVEEKKQVDLIKIKYDCKIGFCQTCLHVAARKDCPDLAKYLIEKGSDVNAKDITGRTPLYDAAKNGRLEIVKSLVNKGADVNVKDSWGQTPLGYASGSGHTDVEKYLESKGARRKRRSTENKNSLIDNNQITNGGSNSSSWVNDLCNWIKDSVGSLFGPQVASLGTQSLPKEITSDSNPKVTSLEVNQSQVDVNGTILLLDTFIRKLTGQKYIPSNTSGITEQEALGYALNVTENFKRIIEQVAFKSGISMHRLKIDFVGMQREITREVMSGKFKDISGVISFYIENACPDREVGCPDKLSPKKYHKFITRLNKEVDVTLNQLMQQILHDRSSALGVNDVQEQQMNLKPKSYLNNTSVTGYLTQEKGLRNESRISNA